MIIALFVFVEEESKARGRRRSRSRKIDTQLAEEGNARKNEKKEQNGEITKGWGVVGCTKTFLKIHKGIYAFSC